MGTWLVSVAGMGAGQRQDICDDLLYGVIQIAAIQASACVICDELGCGGGVPPTQYHNSVLSGEAGVMLPAQYWYHQMEIVGGEVNVQPQPSYCLLKA